jgi:inner membrane transporter RhtA
MGSLAPSVGGVPTLSSSAPFFEHLRGWVRRAVAARSLAALVPAPFYVLTGILLLQVGSATAKGIIGPDNVIGLVFLRNALGAALLWVVVRPDPASLTPSQWGNVLGLGAVLAAFSAGFYYTLNFLPLGIVMTFGFLGALAISIVGARRPLDYLWPVLALAGIVLLTPLGGAASLDPFGLFCGFGYALLFALYIVMSSRCSRSTTGLTGLCLATAVAAILTAPLGLPHVPEFLASRDTAVSVLVVALFAALPFGLEFLALKRLSPAVFGVLLSTEPAVAALVGMIMLGEFLPATGWIALAVVSAAAFGASLTGRRDPP